MNEWEYKLQAAALDAMGTGDASHDLSHLRRVRANALAIASGEADVDHEVLVAAVWLHDSVNLEKGDPRRAQASRMAASLARELLSGWGIAEDKINAVAHAIEAHSFSAGIPPVTIEAKILRDADRLDALGAIGIARTFSVNGRLNRPIYDPEDPWAEHRPLDDTRFGIDHFHVKLLKLGDVMMTDTGRRIAHQRTEMMRQFLEQLRGEIGA
jgi:uncharacterized protein